MAGGPVIRVRGSDDIHMPTQTSIALLWKARLIRPGSFRSGRQHLFCCLAILLAKSRELSSFGVTRYPTYSRQSLNEETTTTLNDPGAKMFQ